MSSRRSQQFATYYTEVLSVDGREDSQCFLNRRPRQTSTCRPPSTLSQWTTASTPIFLDEPQRAPRVLRQQRRERSPGPVKMRGDPPKERSRSKTKNTAKYPYDQCEPRRLTKRTTPNGLHELHAIKLSTKCRSMSDLTSTSQSSASTTRESVYESRLASSSAFFPQPGAAKPRPSRPPSTIFVYEPKEEALPARRSLWSSALRRLRRTFAGRAR